MKTFLFFPSLKFKNINSMPLQYISILSFKQKYNKEKIIQADINT